MPSDSLHQERPQLGNPRPVSTSLYPATTRVWTAPPLTRSLTLVTLQSEATSTATTKYTKLPHPLLSARLMMLHFRTGAAVSTRRSPSTHPLVSTVSRLLPSLKTSLAPARKLSRTEPSVFHTSSAAALHQLDAETVSGSPHSARNVTMERTTVFSVILAPLAASVSPVVPRAMEPVFHHSSAPLHRHQRPRTPLHMATTPPPR